MKFCITGLPRSRTAWFAAYFTATGNKCAHEPFAKCRTEEEVDSVKSRYEGISDSFMVFVPYTGKQVIIERDKEEVRKSLFHKFGMDIDLTDGLLEVALEKMQFIDGLRVKYSDINDRLQEIHEYCVDTPYDEDTGNLFKDLNIQVNKMTVTKEFKEIVGGVLCQRG